MHNGKYSISSYHIFLMFETKINCLTARFSHHPLKMIWIFTTTGVDPTSPTMLCVRATRERCVPPCTSGDGGTMGHPKGIVSRLCPAAPPGGEGSRCPTRESSGGVAIPSASLVGSWHRLKRKVGVLAPRQLCKDGMGAQRRFCMEGVGAVID